MSSKRIFGVALTLTWVAMGCGGSDASDFTVVGPAAGQAGAGGSSNNAGGAAQAGKGGSGGAAVAGKSGSGGATAGKGGSGNAGAGASAGKSGGAGASGKGGSGNAGTGAGGAGGAGKGGSSGATTGGASGVGGSMGGVGGAGKGGASGGGAGGGKSGSSGSGGGSSGSSGSGGGSSGSSGSSGSGGSSGSSGSGGSGGSSGSSGSSGTGGSGACVPTGPEVCNGVDDDCNGMIDEGDPGGGNVCATGLLGVCAAGTTACTGAMIVCNQDVQPSVETCNNADDDCNGLVDDGNPGGGVACGAALGGCATQTACIGGVLACAGTFVAPPPLGDDTNPGTQAKPLATINAAIGNAVAIGGGTDVCVCDPPAQPSATYTEDVTMVEGTSVLGGYRCDTWARTIATYVTRIQDTTATGVKFPSGITAVTALDGMTVVGLPQNSGQSSAISVTDSSPTIVDVTAQGAAAPISHGLSVVSSGAGAVTPAITRGSYSAQATPAGTQIAISLQAASPVLLNVNVAMAGVGGVATAALSVGIDCVDCGATSITGGNVNAGAAVTTVVGLQMNGDVTGFTTNGASFLGGQATAANSTATGVLIASCTGAPAFTGGGMVGGFGANGTRIGLDVTAASPCAPSASGGTIIGCENSSICIGARSTGPLTLTGITSLRGSVNATSATYGIQCLAGGCTQVTGSTITAGGLTPSGTAGAGVDIESTSPLFDSNNITAPVCQGLAAPGPFYGAYLTATSATVTNNVIRDSFCNVPEEIVHFEKVTNGPALFNPIVVNDTLQYAACNGCGARRGIVIASKTLMVGPGGTFNNDIIRNTSSGAKSWPVWESDVDSAPLSFQANDLFDATAVAIYQQNGVLPLNNIGQVNAMVNGASACISADPLLDATWHLAVASPCKDKGVAANAPKHDFDAQARPNNGAFDIGADEFY